MNLMACPDITEKSMYLPEGFIASLFRVSGEEIDNQLPLRFSSDTCPLNLIVFDKVRLKPKNPVIVKYVQTEDGYYIAENENLNIYAFGETRDEALYDFKSQIVHFFYHFSEKKMNELVGLAKDLKRYYRDNFKEVR